VPGKCHPFQTPPESWRHFNLLILSVLFYGWSLVHPRYTTVSDAVEPSLIGLRRSGPSDTKAQIAWFRFEGHHDAHNVFIGHGQTAKIVYGRPRLV